MTILCRRKYRVDGLLGGHIIMLGKNCEEAAVSALRAYPMGMQIGGFDSHTLNIVVNYMNQTNVHAQVVLIWIMPKSILRREPRISL